MADDKDVQDIKAQLSGIAGWIESQKAKSVQDGKPWGWVMTAIAAITAFVVMALAAYDAWRKGAEIARLKHEIDLAAEQKKQAEVDLVTTHESLKISAQLSFIAVIDKQIANTKKEIDQIERDRLILIDKIDKVNSWNNFDELIRKD
jgi:hypothetical protein